MLPPDSITNIRAVLDQDRHALPVWAVRAIRLCLDELDAHREGAVGGSADEEMATVRRRIELAKQLLVEWQHAIDTTPDVPPDSDALHYRNGHVHATRSCMHDLRTVLTGGI